MHPGSLALILSMFPLAGPVPLGSSGPLGQDPEQPLGSLQHAVRSDLARVLGSPLRNLEDHGSFLDLSPDGGRAMVIGRVGSLVVFDPMTEVEFHREEPLGEMQPLTWGRLLPGCEEVIALQEDETVVVIELDGGQRREVGTFPGARGPATVLLPNGGGLISNTLLFDEEGYEVSTLARFDLESGNVTTMASPLASWVRWLESSPDGSEFFVQVDGTAELIRVDSSSLEVLGRIPLEGEPTALALAPDGSRLAVAYLDEVKVLDLSAASPLGSYRFDGLEWIDNLLFGPSGATLYLGQGDAGLVHLDTTTGATLFSTLDTGRGALEFAVSDDLALVSTYAGTRCLDASSGQELGRPHAMEGEPLALEWSPDGKRIAAGTGAGDFAVFDTESGARLGGAPGNPAPFLGIEWIGGEAPWITCDDRLGLATWETDGGRDPSMIREVDREVWDFARAGDLVWALARSGEVLWSFDSRTLNLGAEVALEGELFFELVPRGGSMSALLMGTEGETQFAMDRNRMGDARLQDGTAYNAAPVGTESWVRVHEDGRITRGDGLDGVHDWTLIRHPLASDLWDTGEAPFYRVAASPSGELFALASNTHVSLFDALTGEHLGEIPTPLHSVSSLAWGPNGRHLALGIQNESVLLLDIDAWLEFGLLESLYVAPAEWGEPEEEPELEEWERDIAVVELEREVEELRRQLHLLDAERHHELILAEEREHSMRSEIEFHAERCQYLEAQLLQYEEREAERDEMLEEERSYWVDRVDLMARENDRLRAEIEALEHRSREQSGELQDKDPTMADLKAEHQRLLTALRTRIEAFRQEHGVVPPGSVAELRALDPRFEGLTDGEQRTYTSNETLVLALGLADDDEWLFDVGNTDLDLFDDTTPAPEVLDPWTRPWVYLPAADYEKGSWFMNEDFEEFLVPARRKADGSYRAPNGYQLFSLGPH